MLQELVFNPVSHKDLKMGSAMYLKRYFEETEKYKFFMFRDYYLNIPL
jgi:hypothetical protein